MLRSTILSLSFVSLLLCAFAGCGDNDPKKSECYTKTTATACQAAKCSWESCPPDTYCVHGGWCDDAPSTAAQCSTKMTESECTNSNCHWHVFTCPPCPTCGACPPPRCQAN